MEEREQAKPVQLAVDVAMAGMDPVRFLESDDPVEIMVMYSIAQQWFRRKKELHKDLAFEIVDHLARSFNKKG